MTGLENAQAIVLRSSTVGTSSCDPSEGNDHEYFATTQEVCTRVAAYGSSLGGFGQIPSQVIVQDIQDAEENTSTVESTSSPAETTVNVIGSANTAVGKSGSIDSTSLQPLRIFNAVVTGIVNVCLSK